MSNYEAVTVEREGAVARVSFNRPDMLNAFNAAQRADILAAAQEVNADDDIRVVILTGVGRAFSAGADLSEGLMNGDEVEAQINEEYKPALLEIVNAPKPWVAAVAGASAGIGSAFTLSCDLVVMAESAYIYQAFTAISLVPDGGATWHLVQTLGRHRAYELIVSGEKLRAEKCQALGLCNRVVADDSLQQEAMGWAQELTQKAPLSLRYAKEALNAAIDQGLPDAISNEARLQNICIESEDSKEGGLAFMEKRAPVFKGR